MQYYSINDLKNQKENSLITFYISDFEVIKEAINQNLQLKYYCIINEFPIDLSKIQFLSEYNIDCEIHIYNEIPDINQKIFEYFPEIKIYLVISKDNANNYISFLQQLHNLHFKNISISPDFEDNWTEKDWEILQKEIKFYCDFLAQRLMKETSFVRLLDFEIMCQKIFFHNLKCLTQHEPDNCILKDECLQIKHNHKEKTISCKECACCNICHFIVNCNKVRVSNVNINQCYWNKILIQNILYFLSLFEIIKTDKSFKDYIDFLLRG